jgi:hypothetical protein
MVRSGYGEVAADLGDATRRSTLPIGPPAGQTRGGREAKRLAFSRIKRTII